MMKYTSVTNPQWADAERTALDCLVYFDSLGVVPFTAKSDDVEQHSRDIFAAALNGDFGDIADYAPPTPEHIRALMPAVTRVQFAIALARFGVISAAEAKAFAPGNALPAVAINAIQNSGLSDADKLDAEIKALSADTIRRTNPLIAMMQAATGLTDEQADNLFTTAAGID